MNENKSQQDSRLNFIFWLISTIYTASSIYTWTKTNFLGKFAPLAVLIGGIIWLYFNYQLYSDYIDSAKEWYDEKTANSNKSPPNMVYIEYIHNHNAY